MKARAANATATIALFGKATWILIGFAGLVLASAIIGVFMARPWGAASKRNQQAIFSIVTFVGIIVASVFTLYRIRHLT